MLLFPSQLMLLCVVLSSVRRLIQTKNMDGIVYICFFIYFWVVILSCESLFVCWFVSFVLLFVSPSFLFAFEVESYKAQVYIFPPFQSNQCLNYQWQLLLLLLLIQRVILYLPPGKSRLLFSLPSSPIQCRCWCRIYKVSIETGSDDVITFRLKTEHNCKHSRKDIVIGVWLEDAVCYWFLFLFIFIYFFIYLLPMAPVDMEKKGWLMSFFIYYLFMRSRLQFGMQELSIMRKKVLDVVLSVIYCVKSYIDNDRQMKFWVTCFCLRRNDSLMLILIEHSLYSF